MKRLFGLALAGLLILGVSSAPAVAGGDIIKVMTRNQYLGDDLTPLIEAAAVGDPELFIAAAEDALTNIAENNFLLRARRLATEVALTNPDAIVLNEVYNFTVNNSNPEPPMLPFVDHLQVTLDALADKNRHYVAVARVEHLDVTIPIDIDEDGIPELVGVVDSDVILVREELADTAIALGESYLSGGLCEVPSSLLPGLPPGLPSLLSTSSEEGCNFTIRALVPTSIPGLGTIVVERGFVGVDLTVRGRDYRIVGVHLEVREPDGTPNTRFIQSLQSVQLMGTLEVTTSTMSPNRTLILLGDINSCDEDVTINGVVPPYQVITGTPIAGTNLMDIWDLNHFTSSDPGYTCCQEADLSNRRSQLDERIDIIFVRDTSFLPWAFVVGRVPIFPLFWPPNWASDHGGVFAKLIFK